jgi:hypothetical protein
MNAESVLCAMQGGAILRVAFIEGEASYWLT